MKQYRPKNVSVFRWMLPAIVLCTLAVTAYTQTIDASAAPPVAASSYADDSDFRVETLDVAGGAELITIFARHSSRTEGLVSTSEMPMLSVVRDTLGDSRPENDRLRFVYMMTYTRPSFLQRVAGFVPFLYTRTTNKTRLGSAPPPPLADMQRPEKAIWRNILWLAFKKILLSEVGIGTRASASQYKQNASDRQRSAVASALTVLSLYEKVEGEKVFTDAELRDIQARLWLRDEPLGPLMQAENLERVYEKKTAKTEDTRAHNWELLRQYAEAAGLYFEPVTLADGTATHALVWIAREEIAENKGRKFERRFLNIKDPWSDEAVTDWRGYTQERWFGEEGRVVDAGTPGAVKRTMIPLALYGLDTPKIPALLIDFRDRRNPKRREISRRVLNDVTRNVLAIGRFSSLSYLVGRAVYEFATRRRGMDVNQASRLRSYAQLKTLLALDATLEAGLRHELADRIEDVSVNPLENDLAAEAKIARVQYRNLVEYARRPDGLPARLDRDRREEMVRLAHSGKKQNLLTALRVVTFGIYKHREKATPELNALMDERRQLEFHERALNEVASRSIRPEVDSDLTQLRRSITYVSEHGSRAGDKTARSLSRIFAIATQDDIRRLCLLALYQIDRSAAKNELLAIYNDSKVGPEWRDLSVHYLKESVANGKRISPGTAATVAGIGAN